MHRDNRSRTTRARRAAVELILRDEQHRTANELSSALAALKLTVRDHGAGALPLVDSAIERLEGFVAVRRILANPEEHGCDIVECLRDLAIAMERGRPIPGGLVFTTSTLTVRLMPDLARILSLDRARAERAIAELREEKERHDATREKLRDDTAEHEKYVRHSSASSSPATSSMSIFSTLWTLMFAICSPEIATTPPTSSRSNDL